MCQADDGAKCTDGVAPDGALQSSSNAGARKEVTTTRVDGITHELDGGRSVFVGQSAGDSRVFIKFWNGEMDTKIALSFEAAAALRDLLGSISMRGLDEPLLMDLGGSRHPKPG